MEESIMKIMKIDNIWNNKRNRNYVWGRMFYIYYHVYVEKRNINGLLNKFIFNGLRKNQVYYLIYKSRYNMEKNEFFKYQYANILNDLINLKYSLSFDYKKVRTKRTKNLVV